MTKLYSPSSRQDFSFCPRYWWLRKRYQPRRVGYPELCGIGGSAVAEALAWWNRARCIGQAVTVDACLAKGWQSIVEARAGMADQGRFIGTSDVDFADRLPDLMEQAVRLLWTQDPLATHTIIAAEQEFPDFGNARIDVVSRDAQGQLVVDDYKCKFGKFDLTWLDREFEKHFTGEQRMSYTQMVGTDLFGIILVMLQPHVKEKVATARIERRVSRVLPNEVRLWKNDAALDYERMQYIEQRSNPWMVWGKSGPHTTPYGDCAFKGACTEYNFDPAIMDIHFVKVTP
jgi:hypothetical protein